MQVTVLHHVPHGLLQSAFVPVPKLPLQMGSCAHKGMTLQGSLGPFQPPIYMTPKQHSTFPSFSPE